MIPIGVTHYILITDTGVYVKTARFFEWQGGRVQPWGKKWQAVTAESIEAARAIGEQKRRQGQR